MISRGFSLFGLSLLLVSCDKPKNTATEPADQNTVARVTKSDRPEPRDSPKSPDQLQAAIKAAGKIGPAEEKNRALAAAIWDAMDLEPELARQSLQKLTAGSEEKTRLLQHFAMRLAEQNVDDAVQWADSLETEDEKSQAFGKIALVLSATEPERAARLLSDSGVSGRDFDVAVVQVVQRWAAQSPSDAAAWAILFDAGEARSAALKETVGAWARTDAPAAFSWITAIQDEQLRADAVAGMVETILDQPDSVQKDLLKLAPPEMRTRLEMLKAEAAGE
jgi:hypothetical protein